MNPKRPSERRRTDESNRERAVSDVVAFVLTFSIIIAGVGIVSTGGFDQLSQFTNDQQVNNAERGMEATASTVDNIHRSGDTYREFDLALNGGNIWLNETEMTLESDDIDLSPLAPDANTGEATIQTNALEHRFDLSEEVNIAYEGGAVFRSDTARPRYEPGFRLEDDTAIISLVNLTTDTSIDRSGAFASDIVLNPTGVPSEAPVTADSQFISFRAEHVDQEQVYETDVDNLELDVSGAAYPDQWEFYFENVDEDGWDSDEVTYELEDADSVLIRVTTIELSLLPRGTL